MFESISKNVTTRIREVHRLLAHIHSLEQVGTADRDVVSTENARTLRGLFFVNLYGAFEYAVTQSVQILLQEIGRLQLPYLEFEHLLHSVVLDGLFKAVADVNSDNTWAKRRDLLERQVSAESCRLDDTVFQMYLQNVRYNTLKTVFDCLCISTEPVPDIKIRGYIDLVVEKRNEVAHGRSSPQMVGASTTANDLQAALNAITEAINHILAAFENHLMTREFVATSHRHKYTESSTPTRI
jgi:MAE_28990/MAE_18760-like HEPN